jgi:hypothetical protein
LTGTIATDPGLRQALTACRRDTLIVSKLDRLALRARVRNIADELTAGEVRLNIGGSVHGPLPPRCCGAGAGCHWSLVPVGRDD